MLSFRQTFFRSVFREGGRRVLEELLVRLLSLFV